MVTPTSTGRSKASVTASTGNWCVPYREPPPPSPGTPLTWCNYETYQIITPGLDGLYGQGSRACYRKTGQGFTEEDKDNLTNFSKGRLEDELE